MRPAYRQRAEQKRPLFGNLAIVAIEQFTQIRTCSSAGMSSSTGGLPIVFAESHVPDAPRSMRAPSEHLPVTNPGYNAFFTCDGQLQRISAISTAVAKPGALSTSVPSSQKRRREYLQTYS